MAWLILASTARAQQVESLQRIRLPEQQELSRGFSFTISYPKMLDTGYMPLSVKMRPEKAFVRDRNFRIVIDTIDSLVIPNRQGFRYEIPVPVQEGQKNYEKSLMLPKWYAGQSFTVKLLEDDQALAGYEASVEFPITSTTPLNSVFQSEFLCDWLFISSDLDQDEAGIPSLKALLHAWQSNFESEGTYVQSYLNRYQAHFAPQHSIPMTAEVFNNFWVKAENWSRAGRWGNLIGLELDQLSSDWRSYQNRDAIIIHPSTLDILKYKKPEIYSAIQHWQMLGGTMVVLGPPPEPIESKAKQTTTETADSSSIEQNLAAVRENEMKRLYRIMENSLENFAPEHPVNNIFVLKDAEGIERFHYLIEEENGSGKTIATPIETEFSKEAMNQFRVASDIYHHLRTDGAFIKTEQKYEVKSFDPLYHVKTPDRVEKKRWGLDGERFGLGQTFYLFADQTTLAETGLLWQFIQDRIGDDVSPTLRRGIDVVTSGHRFNDWKIPGISEPPVYTFIGFLTSFFVFVGPLAYWQTKRVGRPYLMFFIAPVLAIATTLAMFGYGIVADGFTSIARIRQITWVDGKSRHGVERIRSTYFAGVEIKTPIQFPSQAEVFPFFNHGGATWQSITENPPSKLGSVTIDPPAQDFTPTLIPPRVQSQFVSHHPRPNIGCLSIHEGSPSSRSTAPLSAPLNAEYPSRERPSPPMVVNEFAFTLTDIIFRDEAGWHWHVPKLAPGKERSAALLASADASKLLGQLYINHRPIGGSNKSSDPNRRSYRDTAGMIDFPLYISQGLNSKAKQLNGKMETWLQNQLLLLGELPVLHFVATSEISKDAIAIENCETKSSVHYLIGTLP